MRREQNTLLTYFSPILKEWKAVIKMAEASEEIDLLFATDCISEGQNLQDCDFLINYDIHWNPGPHHPAISGASTVIGSPEYPESAGQLPRQTSTLDEYINLEERVSGRMVLLDISANGEENVIEYQAGDEMNDLHYRKRQLEQLQNKVLDYEDLNDSISITDLTLNDFRMDLAEYVKTRKLGGEHTRRNTFRGQLLNQMQKFRGMLPERSFSFVMCTANSQLAMHTAGSYFLVHVSDAGQGIVHGLEQPGRKCLELFKGYAIDGKQF